MAHHAILHLQCFLKRLWGLFMTHVAARWAAQTLLVTRVAIDLRVQFVEGRARPHMFERFRVETTLVTGNTALVKP